MSGTKTIIGEGAVIRGQIEGAEDLQVAGRLEGSISLTETLIVDPEGMIQADVAAKNVVLNGLLIGNIEAAGSVQIGSGGRMVGDIRAPEVMIEEGGALRGHIDMGEFALETPASQPMRRESTPAIRASVPTRGNNIRAAEPRTSVYSHESKPAPAPKQSAPPVTTAWSTPVTRPPMPRPSVVSPAPNNQSRPAAPPPKLRNIGRAKARKVPR